MGQLTALPGAAPLASSAVWYHLQPQCRSQISDMNHKGSAERVSSLTSTDRLPQQLGSPAGPRLCKFNLTPSLFNVKGGRGGRREGGGGGRVGELLCN